MNKNNVKAIILIIIMTIIIVTNCSNKSKLETKHERMKKGADHEDLVILMIL